jgi:hypothetical protein
MSTSYSIIKKKFESEPQSKVVLPDELILEFFDSALGEYELELNPLNYNALTGIIEEDLTRSQILILAKLMYKYYISRDLDKYMKLQSMTGENLSVTGLGDSKKTMASRLESISTEINTLFSKIKDSSYIE